MKRFVYFLFLLTAVFSCQPRDRYVTITGYAQGGTYAVKFNMNAGEKLVDESPEEIRDSIDAILKKIDFSLSGYNKNSVLSRFNQGETVVPDSLFIDIYSHARDIYEETCGKVDVSSGPLFDMWGFGFRSGEMPDDKKVAELLSACGLERLLPSIEEALSADGSLSPESLLNQEMTGGKDESALPRLNYNAIAQGYSCDLVAEYLYSIGVKDMMVDIGEIFCDGHNPNGLPWTLGIDRPEDGNNDPGANIHGIFHVPEGPHGVVTSGNYRKFYLKDGKKYSHTIDPQTGYPVDHNLLSATIVADDALTADAYATYCMVIGYEEAVRFLEQREDLEGCLVYDQDGTFATWCSSGFKLEQ